MLIQEGIIEVGDKEKHKVYFRLSRWWGTFSVKVDDVNDPIIDNVGVISGPFSVVVGDKEKHTVTFQIILQSLFTAFRKPKIQVLVDGKLKQVFN